MEGEYFTGATPIWMQVISLVLNLVFGGGLILTLITLRSFKLKSQGEALQATAQAEVVEKQAESSEIDNVEKIARMWREQAEAYEEKWKKTDDQVGQLCKTIEELRAEVKRLVNINTKMVKSLDKINAENYEKIIDQIKADLHSDA